MALPTLRRPRLPSIGQPRRLSPAEAAALRARPWPRLPWWLWATVAVTVAAVAVVTTLMLRQAGTASGGVALGAVRSPPGAGLTHDVGVWQAPALDPANAGQVTRAGVTCPRLAGVTVAGTAEDTALLRAAAEQVCALRSVGGIDSARAALAQADAVVAFAGFEVTGNDSTTVRSASGGAPVTVLVNGKYARGAPERIAPLLIHEGAHLAATTGGTTDPAAAELSARRAEADACARVFTGPDAPQPNRGCTSATQLLQLGDRAALSELRAAGYR